MESAKRHSMHSEGEMPMVTVTSEIFQYMFTILIKKLLLYITAWQAKLD